MIQIYKTINGKVTEINEYEPQSWIRMTNPTEEEIDEISDLLNIEDDFLRAALDRQETSRVEIDDDTDNALITVNIPSKIEPDNDLSYDTLPIGIIATPQSVVTVCLEETHELNSIVEGKVKHVFTNLRTRFVLQIIYQITVSFIFYLRAINRKSSEVENKLHVSFDNQQLFQMLDLEKSTVFFSTALKANQVVADRISRGRVLTLYEDDEELIEDIQIEVKQAISMCDIYSNILSGTMDAYASIISNNLNIVMKVLTAITILMAIPTMVASFYGMNVASLPLANFWFVLPITLVLTLICAIVLYKFNMFS